MENQAWQLEMTKPLWLASLLVLPLLIYYWHRGLVHFAAWQRTASLVARTVLLVLLVVALCGVKVVSQSNQPFVVFAVDRSSSISEAAREKADKFVAEAHANRENRSAIVEFAATAEETTADAKSGNKQEKPDTGATNIAAAIGRAGSMIPADCVGKIVLLSEGRQTVGDALAAAEACAVPISTVPLPKLSPEVYVAAVETPAEARLGESFKVEVLVQSNFVGEGKLTFQGDGKTISRQTIPVAEGENRFSFEQIITEGAAATFTAQLNMPGDTLSGNNELAGVVLTRPPPKVLLVESEAGAGRHLAEALSGRLIEVKSSLPTNMPKNAVGLETYDLVILSNISAEALPLETMEALQQYVREFGGGLIVTGGEKTFTPGGYKDTVLAEVLPLRCNIRQHKSKPSLAMALVLDRSGSMKGQSIELAKQATRRAVEMLGPRDQVGIIAFEDKSHWVSPMGPCSDKQQVFQRIDTITAAGGTNMYPAMDKAFAALDESFADLKHIIVLTDGLSHPGDFQQLTQRMAAAGITVSTVAVGNEAAPELLQDIAKTGKGKYYHCADAEAVPRIFAMETISAAKLGITEKPFIPRAVESSDMLAGLDLSKVPTLLGYAETLPKPRAHVLLSSETGDPLLASWKYGRGTSVAFTSDVRDRWAAAWLVWPDFPLFWEKLARGTMRKNPFRNYVLRAALQSGASIPACREPTDKNPKLADRNVRPTGRVIEITLDAIDRRGRLVNGARAELEVSGTGIATRKVPLEQVAPGRYATQLKGSSSPTQTFRVKLQREGEPSYSAGRGLVTGFVDELRAGADDTVLLDAIAERSGGTSNIAAAEVFAAGDDSATRTMLLWPYLLAAAALVFILDVTLKRVELG